MRQIALLLALFFLVSCSDDSSSSCAPAYDDTPLSFEKDKEHEGFIKIQSKGHFTYVGTNSSKANPKERPEMKVVFDYDFSIAEHEVTEADYAEIMGGEPGPDSKNWPVTNVTYGDIIIFANKKSKSEGFDTVYSYKDVNYDQVGHVVGFESLVINYDVAGYRLPTEAEWIFVAAQDWNPSGSWNEDNAGGHVHDVCSREKNSLGICDMAGNAKEWVGDWLGNLKDTTITNFVGAPNDGVANQLILKGGCFKSSPSNINLYTRLDRYDVSISTHDSRVGGRLVFGPIDAPVYWDGNGDSNSGVKILEDGSSIRSKLGTLRAKIVFVADSAKKLKFVDYAENGITVHQIEDDLDVLHYHPDISPDGEWVAFCTIGEGSYGKSEVYVMRLNSGGENLSKLNVESAAIPRFGITAEGDTVITYVDNAGDNTENDNFGAGSTWQVKFSNGTFGTPEKLFSGNYHGGVSKDARLAVSGSKRLRARKPADGSKTIIDGSAVDTVWYNDEQACNVSLASDGSKRTLFLDFASQTGKDYVGRKYRVHERMFVVDSTGKLVQSVGAPDKFDFDNTEWVRGENLVIASLTNSLNGSHEKIALIDLKDSSIMELLEGDEVVYPAFWVEKVALPKEESFLDLDSAGVYMTSESYVTTRIMRVKMEYFWQYRDVTNVVILGSSRSDAGVDPTVITSAFAVNLSYASEDMTASEHFANNYFMPLMPKLKVLVLALDYDRWNLDGSAWKREFGNVPGFKYDENHDFWKDGVPSSMLAATRNSLKPIEGEYFIYGYNRGLHYDEHQGYSEESPVIDGERHWLDSHKDTYKYNLEKLESIINVAKDNGVTVIGVVFPQSPLYVSKKNIWGRWGLTLDDAKYIANDVNSLTEKYSNFIVMDEYKDGYHDYDSEYFSNDDHLNIYGAAKFSKRLDSLLVEILN